MRRRLAVTLFVLGFLAVAAVTLSPADLRPMTGFPPQTERFAAFFCLGFLAVLGVPRRWGVAVSGLVIAAALLEALQTLVPGRHGRISDFEVKAAGAFAGAAFALLGGGVIRASRRSREKPQSRTGPPGSLPPDLGQRR